MNRSDELVGASDASPSDSARGDGRLAQAREKTILPSWRRVAIRIVKRLRRDILNWRISSTIAWSAWNSFRRLPQVSWRRTNNRCLPPQRTFGRAPWSATSASFG